MKRIYTGIGSRNTPAETLDKFTRLAHQLEADGWILRSGGADGADSAFDAGVEGAAREIFLPWYGFNGKTGIVADRTAWDKAEQLASQVHPAWAYLKPPVRKLHARNCFQILGLDLSTPAELVLCWTPDGAQTEKQRSPKTGGTGTAIALADRHGVPVINFFHLDAEERLAAFFVAHQKVTEHCNVPPVESNSQFNPFAGLERSKYRA